MEFAVSQYEKKTLSVFCQIKNWNAWWMGSQLFIVKWANNGWKPRIYCLLSANTNWDSVISLYAVKTDVPCKSVNNVITWFYPEDAVSTGIFSYQAGWNRNILGLGLCHSVTVCDICSMVSCVISDCHSKWPTVLPCTYSV